MNRQLTIYKNGEEKRKFKGITFLICHKDKSLEFETEDGDSYYLEADEYDYFNII